MAEVKLAMIAAVAENGVIGSEGGLPWRLPTDFRFYKAQTMGKPLVMGRRTFESIGRALPGRENIVVTRDKSFAYDNVTVLDSLDRALAHALTLAEQAGVDEAFVNGGATLYAQALDRADRLYITHVAARPDGDTFFPAFDAGAWRVSAIEGYPPGDKDSHGFVIRRYDRRRHAGFD